MTEELLDLDDIALAIGESRAYVRDKVVKRKDFPAPALVLSRKIVKWSKSDFQSWLVRKAKEWKA